MVNRSYISIWCQFLVFRKSLESGRKVSISKLKERIMTGGGNRANVQTQPGELDKGGIYWHKLAQESEEKTQRIYCKILQAHVRVCKLAACRYYNSCHVTA